MINQPENIRRIYEAFSAGLNSPEIVAYHGTSLSVLGRIVETGLHMGSEKINYRAGEIFVYPLEARAVVPFSMTMLTDEEAQEEAYWFARKNAMEHYLARKLGIDPFKATEDIFIKWYITCNVRLLRSVIHEVTGKESTYTELCRLYDELKTKKGVILGYSQRVLDCGEPRYLTEENETPAVAVKNVDISSLVGIEPLDQEAYDYLSSLEVDVQCMAD